MEIEFNRYPNGNRYRIIKNIDRHVQLECVEFHSREDLGDQIFCDEEGEKIWVAKYHVPVEYHSAVTTKRTHYDED